MQFLLLASVSLLLLGAQAWYHDAVVKTTRPTMADCVAVGISPIAMATPTTVIVAIIVGIVDADAVRIYLLVKTVWKQRWALLEWSIAL